MYRKDVAQLLGVSLQTVIAFEKAGKLVSRPELHTDERGNVRTLRVYDEAEVLAFRLEWKPSNRAGKAGTAKLRGRQHAQAFQLFAQGKTAWDVVAICKMTCDEAAELEAKWKAGPDAVAKINSYEKELKRTEKWQRETAEDLRRKKKYERSLEIAKIRQKSPAPIILARVVPGSGEPVSKAEPEVGSPKPPAGTPQTD
jgi:hypothetical protein